jgi:glycosyltransferase involved in cell wall biosynthesis
MKGGATRRIQGLLVGPFPPPIGGDTVLTNNLWKSRYWAEHGIVLERVDTSPRAGVRLPEQRLSRRDILRGARIFAQFLGKLRRADFVLLWSNSRFLLTAGLGMVAASGIARRRILVKPFGGSLPARIGRMPFLCQRAALFVLGRASLLLPETRLLEHELAVILRLPRTRVLCVPNFLPDSALRRSFSPKPFSRKCVFFGQVKREKGVFDIIDALAERPALSCDFYGPLLERDRVSFLARIAQSRNLKYRGALDPARVGDTMSTYDVLLLPTYHVGEGYPAVILEAFAAGIPVVASRWRSLPELVEDGVRGLLVPPQSPHKIREALDRLSADALLYESLARNGFEFVRSFSEKAIVEGMLIARVSEVLGAQSRP